MGLDVTLDELKVGFVLPNFATVIECKKIYDRVIGETYATWIGLCVKQVNDYHPYVVWQIVATPTGWYANTGHYFFTLSEAKEKYNSWYQR